MKRSFFIGLYFREFSQNSGQAVYLFGMKKILLFTCIVGLLATCQSRQTEDQDLLQRLMESKPEQFRQILDSADFFEVQIIYTQINRDAANTPSFTSYYYHFDSTQYFYPASTVKFPAVLLALEKLQQLKVQHLDKYTPMLHDSVYAGQLSVSRDTTAENYMPSVAHYAKKVLVVSDNDAYNRLYEFLGQRDFNERLHAKGYTDLRIIHRLERPLSPDENAHTEAVTFFQKHGPVYEQTMLVNDAPYVPTEKILKGQGYLRGDSLVREPFDFTYKNFFPLDEQQRILRAVLFPTSVKANQRFDLSVEDRAFVLQYMSQLPGETNYPPYYQDSLYYTDAYCKFFMFGGKGSIPANIRIFNKVGDAYGYLLDNAYIIDAEQGIEFMLTAVINTNTDGIYNDGVYAYDRLGFPFFKNLGTLIYDYERTRKKQHRPDLNEFTFTYDRNRLH